MKKEDVAVLSQLLSTMKESAQRLEYLESQGDFEKVKSVKKELMDFQKKVEELL